jgi:D-3-phosphoglycerate dehydrogenase
VLSDIVLAGDPEREAKTAKVAALTDRAMNGELEFGEALERRIALLRPTRAQIAEAAERLRGEITPSAREHVAFFARPEVHVLSGGFREMIEPTAGDLGVTPERILANTFVFDDAGRASGYDAANPLSRSGGKADAVRSLEPSGEVVAIGDGWTDYEIRAAGAADRFYAFVENVERPRVVAHADRVARSFGDLLRQEGLL